MNTNDLKDMIDTIQNEGRNLTDWEKDFIKSAIGQFKMRGWLSEKQQSIVQRIYDEKTPTGSPFGEPADGIIQKNISKMSRIRSEGNNDYLDDRRPSWRETQREKYGSDDDI